jgi:hypothetical protein
MGGYSGNGGPVQKNTGVDGIMSIEDIQKARNADLNNLGNDSQGNSSFSGSGINSQQHVVPQDVINKMIPDIQNAARDGSLTLPSRDIPHSQMQFTTDQEIQPNKQVQFAPNDTKYIYDSEPDHVGRVPVLSDANIWFDELFIPALAGILFYVVTCSRGIEMSQKFIPSIFKSDGSMKQNGPVILGVCFSGMIYGGIKLHEYIAK